MKKTGFTLIKLMIVLAIFGIMIAVAVPAFNAYGDTSRYGSGRLLPRSGQTVQSTRCVQGILFTTNARGNEKPATDTDARAVKC
jgi:prepilin-type N-terminal cleavage/methylation domain-containing protein